MASRSFNQFVNHLAPNLVCLPGKISIVQEVKAHVTRQGLTLTAVDFGSAGNGINFVIASGATQDPPVSAGSEVIVVDGLNITAYVELTQTTRTQLQAALDGSDSDALVVVTGSGTEKVTAETAHYLTGGIDGVASFYAPGVGSVEQTGVGEYTITLQDKYHDLLACNLNVLAASAVDLVPQMSAEDVDGAKTIVFKLLSGGTATDPSAALTVFMNILLKNTDLTK